MTFVAPQNRIDGEHLVAELHRQLLRHLSSASGTHWEGLAQASRGLKMCLSSSQHRRLRALDDAHNTLRHITPVSCDAMLAEFISVVECLPAKLASFSPRSSSTRSPPPSPPSSCSSRSLGRCRNLLEEQSAGFFQLFDHDSQSADAATQTASSLENTAVLPLAGADLLKFALSSLADDLAAQASLILLRLGELRGDLLLGAQLLHAEPPLEPPAPALCADPVMTNIDYAVIENTLCALTDLAIASETVRNIFGDKGSQDTDVYMHYLIDPLLMETTTLPPATHAMIDHLSRFLFEHASPICARDPELDKVD